jgi:hypothetical protein
MKLLSLAINLRDRTVNNREPDRIIGEKTDPYLKRWYILPRNLFFNVYLHHFLRSDDDRVLHDHPWLNCSFLIDGSYIEHTIEAGGVHKATRRIAGDLKLRRARYAHRIELDRGECWTIFITGPRIREWGFHCQKKWVSWRLFTNPLDGGATTGTGCGENG